MPVGLPPLQIGPDAAFASFYAQCGHDLDAGRAALQHFVDIPLRHGQIGIGLAAGLATQAGHTRLPRIGVHQHDAQALL